MRLVGARGTDRLVGTEDDPRQVVLVRLEGRSDATIRIADVRLASSAIPVKHVSGAPFPLRPASPAQPLWWNTQGMPDTIHRH